MTADAMVDPNAPPPPPGVVVLQMLSGRWVSQAIAVAAELGIADVVPADGLTPAEVAACVRAHGPSVHRLLRALASVGVFVERRGGRFHHTPLSQILRSDASGSVRGMARYLGSRVSNAAWADLVTSIRTGAPAFRRVHGKSFFDHLATAPEEAAAFDHAMHGVSSTEIPAVLAAYDFGACGTIVDVGGGDGTLLRAILAKHPKVRGIVYDLEHVVARTREAVAGTPEGARMDTAAGSFFDSVPAGGDTYLMKHIIHDWDDEQCRRILGNVRRVASSRARVLIVDAVIQPGNEPGFAKLLDLEMLAITEGGLERTQAEFEALLASAGFRLARVVPTEAPPSVVEAWLA
jgi:hypothetical protein